MAEQKFYREQSKRNWFTTGDVLQEHLQTGCLQRIADATELMAKNYLSLQGDADRYKRWYQQEQGYNKGLRLSNAALKGQITKLNKALAASKIEVPVGN